MQNIFIELQCEFCYFTCLYKYIYAVAIYIWPRRIDRLKNYGDIDSKFRYVILAAMRAKQLLSGAKPRVKSKSRNLIRVAQEEVKQGLVDYEIVKTAKEEIEEISDSDEDMFIGEELTPGAEEKPEEEPEEKPEEEAEEQAEEEQDVEPEKEITEEEKPKKKKKS